MKKFTFLSLTVLLFFNITVWAQQTVLTSLPTSPSGTSFDKTRPVQRCATMEMIEKRLQNDPAYRAEWEKRQLQFEQSKTLIKSGNTGNSTARLTSLTGEVNIPVVVHIVLPNPYIITDADVQHFLDRLNISYAGLNPDSTNASAFYSVRGHSLIRFVMAKRTPSGGPTNGIERKVGSVTIALDEPQPIKSTATGGLNPWDHTQYYNLWVGIGTSGLLGIAPEIGVGTAANDGVCIDYSVFASNPCYTLEEYNEAETAVHEIGHNFGLFHTFQGGCSNADFQQLTSTGTLPASLLAPADDTPGQSASTGGCPSGNSSTGCTAFPNPPGKMYQNYMDYSYDACLTMFTKGQVERMHWVLENLRPGYLTSLGAQPPTGGANIDAAPVYVINPGGSDYNSSCTLVSYPVPICPSNISPKVRITNNGLSTMNSVTVGVILNGGAPQTVNVADLNLANGATAVVDLPSISLSNGANVIKIFTSDPNSGPDATPANDTLTTTVTISPVSSLPVTQNFNVSNISPWTIQSDGNPPVWQLGVPASLPPSSATNVYSAVIDHYNYDGAGKHDDIRSPVINTTGLTTLQIKFDIAYQPYSATTADSFVVLISKDCGATYSEVYRKGGSGLATKPGVSGNVGFNPTSTSEWRTETINIAPADLTGTLLVKFRSVADYGNRIWLDNISIANPPVIDITSSAIVKPSNYECSSFAPVLTVKNNGNQIVNGYKVGYIVDNGTPVIQALNTTLAPGATVDVSFNALTPGAGNHTIKFFVSDPLTVSGLPDGTRANDTLTRTFSIATLSFPNVIEGFEGTTFAPANWTLLNPNNNTTWVRTASGKASSYSAFMDNYSLDNTGQLDILSAPPINTVNADALTIRFDVAHKNYPGSLDRLRVLVSTDCGSTFTAVYNKSGATLATAGSSTDGYLAPASSDWRTETISLNNTFTGGNAIIQFENRSDFGNNVFIDNISIIPTFKRDMQVVSFTPEVLCTTAFTPVATVRNNGTEAITGYKVVYRIGTGNPDTTTVTGVNIAPGATATVSLTPRTLPGGGSTITVYSIAPVTASGTNDQYLANDTLVRTVYLTGPINAPLAETFEGGTFVPSAWGLINSDGGLTWQRSAVGLNSGGAAYIRNFVNYTSGQRDALVTPVINYTGVDSVQLSFDLSAATRNAITAGMASDTLEVLVSKDCGNTFTSVYKKWGTALQTIYDNTPVATEYAPNAPYLWRKEIINLTGFAPNGPLQVYFRNTTNNQNDVFIDNVNITTRTLPARLKDEGVIVAPNPFNEQFNIWYVQAPADLKYVTVHSSSGQLIWNKSFSSGSPSNVITVDLTGKPSGLYIVNLGYNDKSKDKQIRIMKSN